MEDVVELEGAVFAVFEPFLGGLVAADIEVPGDEGDVGEVLGFVDVDVADHPAMRGFIKNHPARWAPLQRRGIGEVWFGDEVVAVDGILGDVVFNDGAFQ